MSLPLIKISAAGNRFLIIDRRWTEKSPPKSLQPGVFFWAAALAGPAAPPAAAERDSAPAGKKAAAADSPQGPAKKKAAFGMFLELSGKPLLERRAFLKKALSAKEVSAADGLAVLDSLEPESSSRPLNCDFYNRDGSAAEMCGNAACCLAFYLEAIGSPGRPFRLGKELIRTAKNPAAQSAGGLDRQRAWGAALSAAAAPQGRFPFEIQGRVRHYTLISPGVPHAVINWDFAPFEPFRAAAKEPLSRFERFEKPTGPAAGGAFGKTLSDKEKFPPKSRLSQSRPAGETLMLRAALALRHKNPLNKGAGMNVTFFKVLNDGSRGQHKNSKIQKPAEGKSLRGRSACLRAITFERGVEGWTEACGTGALAAAGVFAGAGGPQTADKIFVQMPGGKLMIQLRGSSFGKAADKNKADKEPAPFCLDGPAAVPLLFSPVKLGFY